MKKHILVISQYFFPEQFRINDICAEWKSRGYKVTVVTGIPNYPNGRFYEGYSLFKKRKESYNGVEVIRIPVIPRGKNPIMLLANYLSFVVSGYFWGNFTKIKADYVFVFGLSPISLALPGIWYAKRSGIPCYLYVQDLWPESISVVTRIKSKQLIKYVGKMVDYIYDSSTRIFTTSVGFSKSIHDRGVPSDKIEYWPQYPEDFYIPLEEKNIQNLPKSDDFTIIFAGNIGLAQGLDILPNTAEVIKKKAIVRVRFVIVGDGRYRNELINEVEEKGVNDMFVFIPTQSAFKIPEYIAASDAAFVSLSDNPLVSMTIPAKLQSYMACGIPIIASTSGETERIIRESDSGLCSKPGDAENLSEAIVELALKSKGELSRLGSNARNYCISNFNKKDLLDKMDKYFEINKEGVENNV